jgi:hypothetical protein
VHAGYVAEAPTGSGCYRITDEGWVVIIGRDDRDLPF